MLSTSSSLVLLFDKPWEWVLYTSSSLVLPFDDEPWVLFTSLSLLLPFGFIYIIIASTAV